MSLYEGFFPVLQQLFPRIVGVVLARENRHTIPHLSPKHEQGGGELGDRVNCVPVGEDCFMKGVIIQGAGGADVAGDYPFYLFHSQFCSTI